MDGAVKEEEGDSSEEERPLLDNVCFVLCRPQGAMNVGGVARVMNNFGVTDLRIVTPEPSALAPPYDAADGATDRAEHPASVRAVAPLREEAHTFAVHADWLLRDALRCETAAEALADVTFVAATTARPRENLPIMEAREAATVLRDAAGRGKIAVVFGNEATGLTNEELALANVGVMIATAGHSANPRDREKYTGGAGPTSLNLSHAVGVIAYELYTQMGRGKVKGFGSRLITVDERTRLRDELMEARRRVDVLRPSDGVGEDGGLPEEDRLLEEKEARAIANVLNAGGIASRDAAALFFLARRVQAAAAFSGVDEAVIESATALYDSRDVSSGGQPPSMKQLANHIRHELGVSLTVRELERVSRAVQGKASNGA